MVPTIVDDTLSYVPRGSDNQMPFDVLAFVEKDETRSTCQMFNAEVCYGYGLRYESETAKLFAPRVFRNEKKASGYFF